MKKKVSILLFFNLYSLAVLVYLSTTAIEKPVITTPISVIEKIIGAINLALLCLNDPITLTIYTTKIIPKTIKHGEVK